MSPLAYLFGGFALAWTVTFVYLWILARRTRELDERIRVLLDHVGDLDS